jgi:nitrogenase molybdenum-iron protein alpha/beta subunit
MQPDLENVKKKIQENRDLLDRIMVKLPGFKGYVEKAEIHDADKVVRNMIGDKLQGFKDEVNAVSSKLVKQDDKSSLTDLEALSLAFEKVLKKVLHADVGSNASAPGVKITEEDRNRLLEYDWRMISDLDNFNQPIADLGTAEPAELPEKIAGLEKQLKDFEKDFDERKNVLLEVI